MANTIGGQSITVKIGFKMYHGNLGEIKNEKNNFFSWCLLFFFFCYLAKLIESRISDSAFMHDMNIDIFIFLSIFISSSPSIYPSDSQTFIYLYIYLYFNLFIKILTNLFINLFIYSFIYILIYLSKY